MKNDVLPFLTAPPASAITSSNNGTIMRSVTTSKAWATEVKKAMSVPAAISDNSRSELEAAVSSISEELKQPMDGGSRLDLIEARTAFRKQLATLAAE